MTPGFATASANSALHVTMRFVIANSGFPSDDGLRLHKVTVVNEPAMIAAQRFGEYCEGMYFAADAGAA